MILLTDTPMLSLHLSHDILIVLTQFFEIKICQLLLLALWKKKMIWPGFELGQLLASERQKRKSSGQGLNQWPLGYKTSTLPTEPLLPDRILTKKIKFKQIFTRFCHNFTFFSMLSVKNVLFHLKVVKKWSRMPSTSFWKNGFSPKVSVGFELQTEKEGGGRCSKRHLKIFLTIFDGIF
jgi:hypothetical protein